MTLTSPHPISSRMDSARLGLLYFVALSASLGTAVSAIGRLLLYLAALVYLVGLARGRGRATGTGLPPAMSWAVLLALAYMALSVLWSAVGPVEALWSWSRHARILTILILLCLIANLAEARAVLRVFVWHAVRILGRGFFWGNVLGFGLAALQEATGVVRLDPEAYYVDRVPILIDGVRIAVTEVVAFAVCAVAMFLPAWAAARLSPVTAMRFR